MRKEIFWAIVIGAIFGLLAAYGVYRVNSKFTPPKINTDETPAPKQISSSINVSISIPKNGDVTNSDSITISGTTKPNALVIVSAEKSDHLTEAKADGGFSQEVELTSGVNQIKVTGLDKNDKQQSAAVVLIVYSSAFTPKSDSMAYLGVVTDIVDSTIQIKNLESEIKQISTENPQVSVVNTKGTNNKAVKLTDVAIGDFIVAMGSVKSNSVLSAERILVTDAVTDPKIVVFAGTFGELSSAPDKNASLYSYENGKLSAIKLKSINTTDQIVSVSNPSLRTIFVLHF